MVVTVREGVVVLVGLAVEEGVTTVRVTVFVFCLAPVAVGLSGVVGRAVLPPLVLGFVGWVVVGLEVMVGFSLAAAALWFTVVGFMEEMSVGFVVGLLPVLALVVLPVPVVPLAKAS